MPPAGPLPPNAERLSVRTPDGDTLHGIGIPPDEAKASPTLILGFAILGLFHVLVAVGQRRLDARRA